MRVRCLAFALLVLVVCPLGADQKTVAEGKSVKITVTADGTQPFTYQWMKNGQIIAGATSVDLLLNNVTVADAANYSAVVSNAVGSAISDNAVLTVTPGAIIAPSNVTVTIVVSP